MKPFLALLSSLRLALGLIAYLALGGLLASLLPQGREAAFYLQRYPRPLAELLLRSGFTRFFTSLPFILPAFLFLANLSACTTKRLLGQLRSSGKRRHGPDILHVGLILLVVGSLLSFSGREEGFVRLAEGDGVELPDGRLMRLLSFQYLQYEDGRPRDWISTVSVEREGRIEIEAYPIRVNHPLKLGRLSIYQVSHDREALEPSAGGGFRELSGLEAVVDPGYGLILLAFLLSGLGLLLTFIQKLGDFHD